MGAAPPQTTEAPWLYRPLRRAIRWMLGVFFRRVQVVGDELVPADGPLLLVGNHPNSLLDPAVLLATSQRTVAFAAKDVLFANPLLRPVLQGVGAVAIRRRVDADGKVDPSAVQAPDRVDNAAAFAALAGHLTTGGAIGIFPEGCSHDEAQLQPLKTGAARVALGACAARPDVAVQIVPVGLNYSAPRRFRSNVLVRFGPPIAVDRGWLARSEADPRKAARELTEQIDLALRALTIQGEDWETLRVLETVRRLYQPPGLSLEARVELGRRFAAGYEKVKDREDIRKLFDAVRAFRARLDAIDLTERDLQASWSASAVLARFWRRTGPALLLLPLAIPGLLLHGPAALLAWWIGGTLTPRRDVIATTKLLVGLALVMLTWLAAGVALGVRWGGMGLAALPLLPLSGLAALRVMERYADGREVLVSLLRFFRFRTEVADLRRERRRLEAGVVAAVVRHLPPDLEPLFLEASAARVGDAATGRVLDWDGRDGEVAAAAMDAQGVDAAEQPAWMAAFAELLAEEPP